MLQYNKSFESLGPKTPAHQLGVSFENDGTYSDHKVDFAIAAGISAMRISTIARSATGKSKYFASVTDIFDYIEITRRKDGKIGLGSGYSSCPSHFSSH